VCVEKKEGESGGWLCTKISVEELFFLRDEALELKNPASIISLNNDMNNIQGHLVFSGQKLNVYICKRDVCIP
jgi:hypothetical protein